MAEEQELYSIVVVGAMNPRLHSPWWYEFLGLLSAADRDAAANSSGYLITPQLAQMPGPQWRVICQESRWEVHTQHRDAADEILSVAIRVFRALEHTPVSAFGFNFHFDRQPKVPNVGQLLASRIAGVGIGLPSSGLVSGQLGLTTADGSNTWTIVLATNEQDPAILKVMHNANYPIRSESKEMVTFDLGEKLSAAFLPALERSRDLTNNILQAIASSETAK